MCRTRGTGSSCAPFASLTTPDSLHRLHIGAFAESISVVTHKSVGCRRPYSVERFTVSATEGESVRRIVAVVAAAGLFATALSACGSSPGYMHETLVPAYLAFHHHTYCCTAVAATLKWKGASPPVPAGFTCLGTAMTLTKTGNGPWKADRSLKYQVFSIPGQPRRIAMAAKGAEGGVVYAVWYEFELRPNSSFNSLGAEQSTRDSALTSTSSRQAAQVCFDLWGPAKACSSCARC
jgi:hypothetical protein